MPIIKNFGKNLPPAIFQPNVFIQGASSESLPWGLILLDTGYSKALAMNHALREAIGIPSGEKVALKIVFPTADLVKGKKLARVDVDGSTAATTDLNVESMLCVDQKLEARGKWYNVISVGFARDLDRMLLIRNISLGAIEHSHMKEYGKGLEVHLPEVILRGNASVPPFHKELAVARWDDNQPYVDTTFTRNLKDPVKIPVLWDTGADINTCPSDLWSVLKGTEGKVLGQPAFFADEVIGHCSDGTELVFREVPFIDDSTFTIGAPILSAFPELGVGPKFTVLLP